MDVRDRKQAAGSNPQVFLLQVLIPCDLPGRAFEYDSSLVHQMAVRIHPCHKVEILLDDNHGNSFAPVDVEDGRADLVDDRRLYPLRRFIEQQQLRPRHQSTRQGQNLLLPTAQCPAPLFALLEQYGEFGKHRVHAFTPVAPPDAKRGGLEVVRHRQRRENFPALGNIGNPASRMYMYR